MITSNILQQTISTEYKNINIGNSNFYDDVWDLSILIKSTSKRDSDKKIDFTYIHSEDMKTTVKLFTYYKLGKFDPNTVKSLISNNLRPFMSFCKDKCIGSFLEITKEIFLEFIIWLKKTKKISNGTGYLYSYIVEDIIKIGQVLEWNVTKTNIFSQIRSKDLWEYYDDKKKNKTKPIPEEIFDKILYNAVNKERGILTKCGIIIQSQTGLRINEVLSLKEGCVKTTSDGNKYMEVLITKTEKDTDPVLHKIFINELVESAVEELENYTRDLRIESGYKELFILKQKEIIVVKPDKWSSKRLSAFIKRWNIRGENGELYPLKSHQFRATFVREAIKGGIPIAAIFKHLSHVSIEMTAHYLTLQQEEIKEIYTDMILSPNSKIAGLRANEIKNKLTEQFRGKTEEEIDKVILKISKSMSFNPLPTGACLYDFRRGNCSDGDGCFFYNCPNYVTEVKFYPILKKELELMDKEMNHLKALGQEREWQRRSIKYKYLKPLVESLEVQINEESKKHQEC